MVRHACARPQRRVVGGSAGNGPTAMNLTRAQGRPACGAGSSKAWRGGQGRWWSAGRRRHKRSELVPGDVHPRHRDSDQARDHHPRALHRDHAGIPSCAATVTDTSSGRTQTPTGTVMFATTGRIARLGGNACTLSGSLERRALLFSCAPRALGVWSVKPRGKRRRGSPCGSHSWPAFGTSTLSGPRTSHEGAGNDDFRTAGASAPRTI